MSVASVPVCAVARVAAQVLNTVANFGGDNFAAVKQGVYDADTIPEIPLSDYLLRWTQNTDTGAVEILSAMCYIDRLCTKTGLRLSRRNVHRVVLSALLAATKLHEDHAPFMLSHYANVGGVSPAELSRLECRFLSDIEWELYVDAEAAEKYLAVFRRNPAWSRLSVSPKHQCMTPVRPPSIDSMSNGGSISSESASSNSSPQVQTRKVTKARALAARFFSSRRN